MPKRTLRTWQDRVAWAVVGLGLVLLLLPRPMVLQVAAPLQTILLAPLRAGTALRQDLAARRAENARLTALAARLAVENARLRMLTRYAAADEPEIGNLLQAPVIARDLATLQRYLVVSRGSRHGVKTGAPVLLSEGLVGKVVVVGEHQSLVQTVLDPDSRTAAASSRSSVTGLVRADRSGSLLLDFVERDDDVRVGDSIVTSGLGGVFPRGLLIGTVVASENRPAELFRHIRLHAAAPVASLDHVFIYQPPPIGDVGDPWLENLRPAEVGIPGDGR